MATIVEENCPACLADRERAVIMDVEHTTNGLLYHCPECGMIFTADELLATYGWVKARYRGA